jgi:hypothetical protein
MVNIEFGYEALRCKWGYSQFQNYFRWLTLGNFILPELLPLTHILEGMCFHCLRGSCKVLLNSFLLVSSFSREFQNYFRWLTLGNFILPELLPLTHILEGMCFHCLRGSCKVLLNSFLLVSSFSRDKFFVSMLSVGDEICLSMHCRHWRIHVEQLINLEMIQICRTY